MINFGLSREQFGDAHFERDILVIRRALKKPPFGWDELNRLLYTWDAEAEQISVYHNGLVPTKVYVDFKQELDLVKKKLNRDRMHSLLRDGATLVMNRLDSKSLVIGQLCQQVSDFVNEKTVCNGYIAFGGKGTFGRHWDTHDVFAVQVIGRKHWRVYKPTFELPLPFQRSRGQKDKCPAEPVFDGVLEQGDIMYIPRGWWHEADPLERTETFHLTVGVHTSKTLDYLKWIAEAVMPSHLEARVTLRANQPERKSIEDFLEVLRSAALDENNIRLYAEGMQALRVPAATYSLHTIGTDAVPQRVS